MKTVVKSLSSWKKQVEVEVPSEEVRPHLDKALRKYQKKIQVDGFRKGRVPLSLIRKRFGDAIQAEATDDLVQSFFRRAVIEEKLAVVSQATVKEVSFDDEKPLVFTAEVEVEPEVEVDHYSGVKVEKESVGVTGEDVTRTLEMLREQRAELLERKGGAEAGDIVEGDVQALDASGVPVIGQKWDNRAFELGKPPLGDAVLEQLRGVVPGEERNFTIVSPGGREGKSEREEDRYSIRVTAVREKKMPELDDAFAKELGEFESLEGLKSDIRERLQAQRDGEAERALRNRIADEIVKRNDFELPPSMVENALNGMWEEHRNRPDADSDETAYREQNRPMVLWNLKWHMLWQKIAEIEAIEVTEEDAEAEIEKMVKDSEQSEKKMRALFKDGDRRRRLRDSMLEERVMAFLKDNAKIKETTPKKPKKSSIVTP